jgi:2-polyprenyl-3-methyl-5-hydroxy-6-metoxy-1,4-benzoquinol methylase
MITDDEIRQLHGYAIAQQNDSLATVCEVALGVGAFTAPMAREKLDALWQDMNRAREEARRANAEELS